MAIAAASPVGIRTCCPGARRVSAAGEALPQNAGCNRKSDTNEGGAGEGEGLSMYDISTAWVQTGMTVGVMRHQRRASGGAAHRERPDLEPVGLSQAVLQLAADAVRAAQGHQPSAGDYPGRNGC